MHARQSLLSDCLSALHSWFCHNGLALNSTKSESILIGTCQRLCTLPPVASPIITGTSIPFSYTIKMLGVTLDQNLTLNKHVSLLSWLEFVCWVPFSATWLDNSHPACKNLPHLSWRFSFEDSNPSQNNSVKENQLNRWTFTATVVICLIWAEDGLKYIQGVVVCSCGPDVSRCWCDLRTAYIDHHWHHGTLPYNWLLLIWTAARKC